MRVRTSGERVFHIGTFIVILLVVVVFLYLFFSPTYCKELECFQENMITCSFASYENTESEAVWGYEINGREGEKCDIEVTLLIAREGPLGIDEYEGLSMNCLYPLGVFDFPEKDLNSCNGPLKEGLQEVIIKNLHEYIVNNVGEIRSGLEGF
jgi:hypothetical protein